MKNNFTKKAITAALSFALVGSLAAPAMAADLNTNTTNTAATTTVNQTTGNTVPDYTLQVNGKTVGSKLCIMVPLRTVAESLGFKVTYSNQGILVDDGQCHTYVTIGSDSYLISTSIPGVIGTSAPFSLGAAPYISNNTTYVPLNLFPPLLGNNENLITMNGSTIKINTKNTDASATSTGTDEIANPLHEHQNLGDLEKAVNFQIKLPTLPAGYSSKYFIDIDSQLAEIFYTNANGDELIYRMEKGSVDDISGDYNVYTDTSGMTVNNVVVSCRGNGTINVATWQKDGFNYSITSDQGLNAEQIKALVNSI